MIRILLLLLLGATPLAAQTFPDAYYVSGVADDDRLNVRAGPSASDDILGSYGPYDLNIEVLETTADGKWGKVGWGETNGWVAMRYLALSDHNDPNDLPAPLTCLGNEPFWNLNITMRGDEYNAPDTGRRDLNRLSSAAAPNGFVGVWEEGPTLNRTLIVERGFCSDGMSDRAYGWRAMLFSEAPDGNAVASGCCTLDTGRP